MDVIVQRHPVGGIRLANPSTRRSRMRSETRDEEATHGATGMTTAELLAELGRRFRVRYGRLEIVFHDGRPSSRVMIEHRLQRGLDET